MLTADDILTFWLDEVGQDRWYAVDPDIDLTARERFGALWQAAMRGACHEWPVDPSGALALLILLDQLSRNMFRGNAKAFAADPLALAIAKCAISTGHDLATHEPERQFFYLPLMHSETVADQERCLRLIMLNLPETGALNLDYAIAHRAVIRRFGRFPSRNAALGRTDSTAELAYRAEGGFMS